MPTLTQQSVLKEAKEKLSKEGFSVWEQYLIASPVNKLIGLQIDNCALTLSKNSEVVRGLLKDLDVSVHEMKNQEYLMIKLK